MANAKNEIALAFANRTPREILFFKYPLRTSDIPPTRIPPKLFSGYVNKNSKATELPVEYPHTKDFFISK